MKASKGGGSVELQLSLEFECSSSRTRSRGTQEIPATMSLVRRPFAVLCAQANAGLRGLKLTKCSAVIEEASGSLDRDY